MGVLEDAFKEGTRNLDLTDAYDRLQAGYVRRRAEPLHKQRPSADGLDLALDITKERLDITTYITQKALDLLQDKDTKKPTHLDLATMSKVTVSSDATNTFRMLFPVPST